MLIRHERPRDLKWYLAGPMFFGDLGTSRLYVLGLAVYFAGMSAPYYVAAICGLVFLVGWIYTIICRINPDGGGVYSSGRMLHPTLGAVGAIMLFANYVITAAISTYEAVKYIGSPFHMTDHPVVVGIFILLAFGLLLGINVVGSRRAGTFALFVAIASIGITALLAILTIKHVPTGWANFTNAELVPDNIHWTRKWTNFVAVVLALSGVESIANMTGIMVQPIRRTAKLAIWPVIGEVVVLNLILIFVVCSVPAVKNAGILADKSNAEYASQVEHASDAAGLETIESYVHPKRIKEHVLEVAARHHVGPIFAGASAIIFGLLLLSATNTAITGMISILYAMSRNRELPNTFAKLNTFGVPWYALMIAVLLPAMVTILVQDLEMLAKLYAIGVVGAIIINLGSCAYNKKLDVKDWERIAMWTIAGVLLVIWFTIAGTNLMALVFIVTMLTVGLTLRTVAQRPAKPVPVPIGPAVAEEAVEAAAAAAAEVLPELLPFDPGKGKILVASRQNLKLLKFAFDEAKRRDSNIFVLFVRDIAVLFPGEDRPMTPEEDSDAATLFAEAERMARELEVPYQPIYAVSPDPSDVILDFSATYAADLVILGVSRRAGVLRALRGDVISGVADNLPEESTLLIHA